MNIMYPDRILNSEQTFPRKKNVSPLRPDDVKIPADVELNIFILDVTGKSGRFLWFLTLKFHL